MFSSNNDELRKNIVKKLNSIINNELISKNIEKSIYNYTIKLSKEKNINRYWSNPIFKNIYLSKIRSIYVNLDKNSYIKNTNFIDLECLINHSSLLISCHGSVSHVAAAKNIKQIDIVDESYNYNKWTII